MSLSSGGLYPECFEWWRLGYVADFCFCLTSIYWRVFITTLFSLGNCLLSILNCSVLPQIQARPSTTFTVDLPCFFGGENCWKMKALILLGVANLDRWEPGHHRASCEDHSEKEANPDASWTKRWKEKGFWHHCMHWFIHAWSQFMSGLINSFV